MVICETLLLLFCRRGAMLLPLLCTLTKDSCEAGADSGDCWESAACMLRVASCAIAGFVLASECRICDVCVRGVTGYVLIVSMVGV